MCISTGNFDSIFSLGFTPFLNFEIWRKWKIHERMVSTTPLKPLNRIAWNFVVMQDIMCRYAFLQEMLIWSFWGAIYIPFFVRWPIPNAWNCHSLYTAFSSNVGAWGMWACSLFLSFASTEKLNLNFAPWGAYMFLKHIKWGRCNYMHKLNKISLRETSRSSIQLAP